MNADILNQRLYERLLDVVGTEYDVQCRRDIFRYMGKVNGLGDRDSVSISAGSLSEGLDLKGSDEDILLVLKNIDVVSANSNNTKDNETVHVRMEMDKKRPGYACLLLSDEEERMVNNTSTTDRSEIICIKRSLEKSGKKYIVSSARFRGQFIYPGAETHGPCVTDGVYDFAIGLQGTIWPHVALERILTSKSKTWLSPTFAAKLFSSGCNYVPVGPKHYYSGTLWRVSFVQAEKLMVFAMQHVQVLCYGLLKIVLKERIAPRLPSEDSICSYFLKTCMFWLIEETDNDQQCWSKDNLFLCYNMCLDKLIEWVSKCFCPNYILPENNMFIGKVTSSNKDIILRVLQDVKQQGHNELERCTSLGTYATETVYIPNEQREARLDFLVFRTLHVYPFDETDLVKEAMRNLELELDQPLNQFAAGILVSLRSSLFQELAQMTDALESSKDNEQQRRQRKTYLLEGCRADRLTGLTLLASFHYTNGCYYSALEILSTVMQTLRGSSGVIERRKHEYSNEEVNWYLDNFCGRGFSLEKKLQSATLRNIVLLDKSAILPEEFQPEANCYRPLHLVPLIVYAHALQYLCFSRTKNSGSASNTLEQMEDVIEKRYFISQSHLSTSLTFLGACHEVNGNLETASEYYSVALKTKPICMSAKYRSDRIEKVKQQHLPLCRNDGR